MNRFDAWSVSRIQRLEYKASDFGQRKEKKPPGMVLTYLSGLSAAQTESISPTSSVPYKQISNQKRRKTFTITLLAVLGDR